MQKDREGHFRRWGMGRRALFYAGPFRIVYFQRPKLRSTFGFFLVNIRFMIERASNRENEKLPGRLGEIRESVGCSR